ncbi:MAG: ABC-2 transporter permease [Oscillospiraceae bacterium]|nr:ABC-2 transporter permease [Oscillospiraceae bacterium]
MKGLIYKDLCIGLRVTKHVLIVAPILLFIVMAITALGPGADPPMYMIPTIFCTLIGMCMMLTTAGQDQASDWFRQGFMMPVTRLQCYHAKLLLHLLCTGCTAVCGVMVSLLSALLFGDMCLKTAGFIFGAAGGMLLLSMVIGIWLNALIIRFGTQKASAMFMILFILFQFLTLTGLLESLLSEGYLVLILICVGAMLMTAMMYCLGRKWIEQKEL